MNDDSEMAGPVSIDSSTAARLLPFVLGGVAGAADMIGFLSFGGLFIAHITGNLVILGARLLAGDAAPVTHMLAVPVFVATLILTRLAASGLERARIASLQPLLLLQSILLTGSVAICVAAGPRIGTDTAAMVLAGMLGVAAMAVQNALVRVSLTGAPTTAVMTTNITTFTMDLGEMLLGRGPSGVAKARHRAKSTGPAIVGFLLGCGLGALSKVAFGLEAMILPTAVSLAALVLGRAASSHPADAQMPVANERSE